MSAEALAAGFYPPVEEDVWNTELLWQPIPIQTVQKKYDCVKINKNKNKK